MALSERVLQIGAPPSWGSRAVSRHRDYHPDASPLLQVCCFECPASEQCLLSERCHPSERCPPSERSPPVRSSGCCPPNEWMYCPRN